MFRCQSTRAIVYFPQSGCPVAGEQVQDQIIDRCSTTFQSYNQSSLPVCKRVFIFVRILVAGGKNGGEQRTYQ